MTEVKIFDTQNSREGYRVSLLAHFLSCSAAVSGQRSFLFLVEEVEGRSSSGGGDPPFNMKQEKRTQDTLSIVSKISIVYYVQEMIDLKQLIYREKSPSSRAWSFSSSRVKKMKQLEKARKIFLERRMRSAQNLFGKATAIVRKGGSIAGLTTSGAPIQNNPSTITSRNKLGSGFRFLI